MKKLLNLFAATAFIFALAGSANAAVILEAFGPDGESFNTITFRDSSNTNYDVLQVRLGYWADGFTATASNTSSWLANFRGIQTSGGASLLTGGNTGYYIRNDAPDLSVALPVGLNQLSTDTYFSLAPIGKPLALIVANVGLEASSLSSATQFALLTDPNWVIPTVTTSNINNDVFLLIGSTTSASVGSFSYISGVGTVTTAVPEPSTGALMMIGAVGLVAVRRLRKV